MTTVLKGAKWTSEERAGECVTLEELDVNPSWVIDNSIDDPFPVEGDIDTAMKAACKEYPGVVIHLKLWDFTRQSWKDGEVVEDHPDLCEYQPMIDETDVIDFIFWAKREELPLWLLCENDDVEFEAEEEWLKKPLSELLETYIEISKCELTTIGEIEFDTLKDMHEGNHENE